MFCFCSLHDGVSPSRPNACTTIILFSLGCFFTLHLKWHAVEIYCTCSLHLMCMCGPIENLRPSFELCNITYSVVIREKNVARSLSCHFSPSFSFCDVLCVSLNCRPHSLFAFIIISIFGFSFASSLQFSD